jgi:hypothetical protein
MTPVECNRLRLGMSFYRLIVYSMRRSITVAGTQAHLPRRDCDQHLNQRQRAWHPPHAPFATTATIHRSIGGFPNLAVTVLERDGSLLCGLVERRPALP